MNRRNFLRWLITATGAAALGWASWRQRENWRWQLDPDRCVECGRCQTACVVKPSAVKCVHLFKACGYCDFCSGYYQDARVAFNTAAENQRCPTGALQRKFIEEPYFEYTVDEKLCIACGKCVKGCRAFGNGSLYLQVRQPLCVNCHECQIARVCEGRAFTRVAADTPYLTPKKR